MCVTVLKKIEDHWGQIVTKSQMNKTVEAISEGADKVYFVLSWKKETIMINKNK